MVSSRSYLETTLGYLGIHDLHPMSGGIGHEF